MTDTDRVLRIMALAMLNNDEKNSADFQLSDAAAAQRSLEAKGGPSLKQISDIIAGKAVVVPAEPSFAMRMALRSAVEKELQGGAVPHQFRDHNVEIHERDAYARIGYSAMLTAAQEESVS